MPVVDILSVTDAGTDYAVHGTVDGAGYRISVPKTDVDAATTRAQKQRVVAGALRDAATRERPNAVGLAGRVTL